MGSLDVKIELLTQQLQQEQDEKKLSQQQSLFFKNHATDFSIIENTDQNMLPQEPYEQANYAPSKMIFKETNQDLLPQKKPYEKTNNAPSMMLYEESKYQTTTLSNQTRMTPHSVIAQNKFTLEQSETLAAILADNAKHFMSEKNTFDLRSPKHDLEPIGHDEHCKCILCRHHFVFDP